MRRLIWRHEHVHPSCCVKTHRVQLPTPLWPAEVRTHTHTHTPPDYMSGLLSRLQERELPAVCFSLHTIRWTEFSFQPVRMKITEDSRRLLVSVSKHKRCRADERMRLTAFLFVFWLTESAWLKAELPSCVTCAEYVYTEPPACIIFSKYTSYTFLNSPGPVLIGSFKYFSHAGRRNEPLLVPEWTFL